MAREDKASATSSTQDAPSGKSGDQDSTSLAARRARLRGTLAKQTVPPDAYAPDPYQVAKENAVAAAAAITAASAIGDQESSLIQPVPSGGLSENGHQPGIEAVGIFGLPFEDLGSADPASAAGFVVPGDRRGFSGPQPLGPTGARR